MDVNKGGNFDKKYEKKIPGEGLLPHDDHVFDKFRKNVSNLGTRVSERGSSDGSSDTNVFLKPAVLLSTGSYNPVHLQHVKVFEVAKEHLEGKGYSVLAGFLSPSHDMYVRSKLRNDSIPAVHRIEMIKLATSESNWIGAHTWEANQDCFRDFVHVAKEVKEQLEEEYRNLFSNHQKKLPGAVELFYVCGADHFMNCRLMRGLGEIGVVALARDGTNICLPGDTPANVMVIKGDFASNASSSSVRRRMKEQEAEGVEDPLTDLLHPRVEGYLRQMSKELPRNFKKENKGEGKKFFKNFRNAVKF